MGIQRCDRGRGPETQWEVFDGAALLTECPPPLTLPTPCPSVPLQEYIYPDARDRQYLLFFHKGVKRTRFDIEKYNKLKDDIAVVR